VPVALERVDGVCPASLGIGHGEVLRKLAVHAARPGPSFSATTSWSRRRSPTSSRRWTPGWLSPLARRGAGAVSQAGAGAGRTAWPARDAVGRRRCRWS